ncbi:MAG: tetraacyldisaccharide 4'-kinase [Thermoguttaceae bacterium]
MNASFSSKLRGFVDGTDVSLPARIFRTAGLPLSLLYSFLARIHHLAYDLGFRKSLRVPRVVISIGNITMGGVGKSPFVAKLTEILLTKGKTPGLISRGYKASSHQFQHESQETPKIDERFQDYLILNDEAKEFSLQFPDVPYFLHPDRRQAAKALLSYKSEINVIVLDDAYQHRKIARDFNVLIIDALNPFGGRHVAPSGFLREPLSAIARADFIVLNRADLISESAKADIKTTVKKHAKTNLWGEVCQRPFNIYPKNNSADSQSSSSQASSPIPFSSWKKEFRSCRILAFCGLGAPKGFQKTLEREGLNVVKFIEFPDHCSYSPRDIQLLAQSAEHLQIDCLITTMKDFVKIAERPTFSLPIYALEIRAEFLAGEELFLDKIDALFSPDPANQGNA